jgi:uncharacterized protein (UPF0548 family)
VISLRLPSDAALATFLREQQGVALSYPEVGATRDDIPPGYRVDRRKEVIGTGGVAFERACSALDRWQMHIGAGVHVTPIERPYPGLTVALVIRASGVYNTSACRVVYRIDEPDRVGFAYGTLRDHPVVGEERFLLERGANDEVTFELLAFSQPSSLLFRVAAPITRRMQHAIGSGYVAALRRAVQR